MELEMNVEKKLR